jgi:hypothetical protein
MWQDHRAQSGLSVDKLNRNIDIATGRRESTGLIYEILYLRYPLFEC